MELSATPRRDDRPRLSAIWAHLGERLRVHRHKRQLCLRKKLEDVREAGASISIAS
jgi:hypothetical protein